MTASIGRLGISLESVDGYVAHVSFDLGEEKAKASAAEIVIAVNSHTALVEALQRTVNSCQEMLDGGDCDPYDMAEAIRDHGSQVLAEVGHAPAEPKPEQPSDPWQEDPTWTQTDWKQEVEGMNTLMGYWEWVAHMKEQAQDEIRMLNEENKP